MNADKWDKWEKLGIEKTKKVNPKIKIVSCWTLGGMYDHNCIGMKDSKGNVYKIRADEIVKLAKGAKFKATKAIKHTYLEVVE